MIRSEKPSDKEAVEALTARLENNWKYTVNIRKSNNPIIAMTNIEIIHITMKRVLLSMLVCMIVLLQRWLNRIVAILFILVGLYYTIAMM